MADTPDFSNPDGSGVPILHAIDTTYPGAIDPTSASCCFGVIQNYYSGAWHPYFLGQAEKISDSSYFLYELGPWGPNDGSNIIYKSGVGEIGFYLEYGCSVVLKLWGDFPHEGFYSESLAYINLDSGNVRTTNTGLFAGQDTETESYAYMDSCCNAQLEYSVYGYRSGNIDYSVSYEDCFTNPCVSTYRELTFTYTCDTACGVYITTGAAGLIGQPDPAVIEPPICSCDVNGYAYLDVTITGPNGEAKPCGSLVDTTVID